MNQDLRIIDPLEKIREDFFKKIKEEEAKKQRLCLHKWQNITFKCSVCIFCEKVRFKNSSDAGVLNSNPYLLPTESKSLEKVLFR